MNIGSSITFSCVPSSLMIITRENRDVPPEYTPSYFPAMSLKSPIGLAGGSVTHDHANASTKKMTRIRQTFLPSQCCFIMSPSLDKNLFWPSAIMRFQKENSVLTVTGFPLLTDCRGGPQKGKAPRGFQYPPGAFILDLSHNPTFSFYVSEG